MRRFLILNLLFLFAVISMFAQEKKQSLYLPQFALKTNALYLATTTLNLGFEVGLSSKFTLDVSGNYNPWTFSDNKKLKHWLIQPELRYWLCDRFNGHFFGLHAHYAEFNVGGIKQLDLEHYRYEGNLYGGGISYGYHWILGNHWSLEGTIGVGYAHIDYDKYKCEKCGTKIKDDNTNYWGPTKIGLSIIYVIK